VRSRVRVGAKGCGFDYLNPARLRLLPQTGLSANESQPRRTRCARAKVRVGAKGCDFDYLNPARLRLLPQTRPFAAALHKILTRCRGNLGPVRATLNG
jgi:hypothetical protein